MVIVVNDLVLELGIHLQQGPGIEEAAVPVFTPLCVQGEGAVLQGVVLAEFQPGVNERMLGLDAVPDGAQAVGKVLLVGMVVVNLLLRDQGRGQRNQGGDQLFIPFDFNLHLGYDGVKGHPDVGEGLVFLGDLVQGVGEVEGVVLLLGIQHQGQFVGLLDQADQPFMRGFGIGGNKHLALLHLGFGHLQLLAKDGQGLGKVLLVQDREGGDDGQKGNQGCNQFLSHILGL